MSSVSNASWFVGKMERDEAVQYLKERPGVAFIVRLNRDGQHCVTARLVNDEFVHTLIEQRAADQQFVVQRRNSAPIVARSIQHALEELSYLSPNDDLYAPAADASLLARKPSSSSPDPSMVTRKGSHGPTSSSSSAAAFSNNNNGGYQPLPLTPLNIGAAKGQTSTFVDSSDGHQYVPIGTALSDRPAAASANPQRFGYSAPPLASTRLPVQPQSQYRRPPSRR